MHLSGLTKISELSANGLILFTVQYSNLLQDLSSVEEQSNLLCNADARKWRKNRVSHSCFPSIACRRLWSSLFFASLGALWKKIPQIVIQCLWQVCRLRDDLLPSLCVLQDRPSAQSQRWNISKPWVPFLLCLVQTWPSFRTGLQILDQKWRAQQSPSTQSDDLRQFSPSKPLKTKQHSWIPCTTYIFWSPRDHFNRSK